MRGAGAGRPCHFALATASQAGTGTIVSAFCGCGMKAGPQGCSGQGPAAGARTLGPCDGAGSQASLLDSGSCSVAQTPQD